jgi:hypothetical protein
MPFSKLLFHVYVYFNVFNYNTEKYFVNINGMQIIVNILTFIEVEKNLFGFMIYIYEHLFVNITIVIE